MSHHALPTPPSLAELPSEWEHDLTAEIRDALINAARTLVVLDDDPTGTQTVHDVPVLTQFGIEQIRDAIEQQPPLLYLSTNSRSLTSDGTTALHRQLMATLRDAAAQCNRQLELISRSDSTLRGHFPRETDTILECWPAQGELLLLMPFFAEGGRLTLSGMHYVLEDNRLVPASQTPFARDPVFGFCSSSLPDYVEEKTAGRVPREEVRAITLEQIRRGGPLAVASLLAQFPIGSVCVADAVTDRDAQVVAAAVSQCGRPILARVAASYVRARAGLKKRPLLNADELPSTHTAARGGLTVVGSHVPKSTAQLEALLRTLPSCLPIELVVTGPTSELMGSLPNIADQIDQALHAGQDVVLFTSRQLVTGGGEKENQAIAQRVAQALVEVVSRLTHRPRYLVAKGGITSSVLASDALQVDRATVMGAIIPGVPVWKLGAKARFPELHYVVFPGNVGGDAALAEVVCKLKTT